MLTRNTFYSLWSWNASCPSPQIFRSQNTAVFLTTMEASVELVGSPAYLCIVPQLSITPHSIFSGFLRLSHT